MLKLSIITINRNNAAGLRKTIESVVSQTYTDFEYIIIDGASTDDSVNIIKEYAEATLLCGEGLGERLYWVSEPDKGIYNAMNKGIKVAKGEYCLFLNSGDCLVDDFIIKKVFDLKLQSDIICGYVSGFENKKKIDFYPPESYTFRHFYGFNIPHQAEFIKRILLVDFSGYNEDLKILSDYEFNIKALLKNVIFKNIDMQIAIVDLNGISSNGNNIQLLNDEGKYVFEKNIPKALMNDYYFYLDKNTYNHPFIHWIIKTRLFKFIRMYYRLVKK